MSYRPKLAPPPRKIVPVTPKDFVDKAIEGDVDVLADLVDRHHDFLNKRDDNGNVALHVASSKGHMQMVEMLLRKGANVDIQDIFGNSPLLYAVDKEHDQLVMMLVKI